ncbi:hypothetical protein G8E00_02665 [Acinetobacter shaoyimingii]|uniref:Uncharacterized protein n=1 Tax=Acinetobacter shaoyimingii TaxID=2715164 RepID=A0A6G8RZW7_9GAMM|nr:hypothetical protein [Acinetobacter shaoyimingii]QIO07405.1 hypothetical protein G8E00_02665 [Acinetobacter shaoyimingii]
MLLVYLGLIIFIIGGIGFLIAAFKNSILWGFGCIFLAPVSLVFLVMYWQDTKNPFFLQLIGLAIIITGSMFMHT